MITAITGSHDLAALLNESIPGTPEDAAETPRDWISGIWTSGKTYPLDPDATTDTLAVLADGNAAVRLTEQGQWCSVDHGRGFARGNAHWCPADEDNWSNGEVRGVNRDWREVTTWDANGYSQREVHPTLGDAKAAFDREVTELKLIDAPTITAASVKTLLDSSAEEPVLYVKFTTDEDEAEDNEDEYAYSEERDPIELDVWANAHVDPDNVITTRAEARNYLGDDYNDELMAAYLAELQEAINQLVADRA